MALGGSRRNMAMPFGMEKLEWCGYPAVKNFEGMFIRFDRICTNVTDTHTQTDTAWQHTPRLQSIARQKQYWHDYFVCVSVSRTHHCSPYGADGTTATAGKSAEFCSLSASVVLSTTTRTNSSTVWWLAHILPTVSCCSMSRRSTAWCYTSVILHLTCFECNIALKLCQR